jgi:multidrug efflux system membrane fusion protein
MIQIQRGTQPDRLTSAGGAELAVRALLVLGWSLAMIAGCSASDGATKGQSAGPVAALPVRVATVRTQAAPLALRAIGTVEAFASVTVKPQVDGRLTKVYFAEGQEVKTGDTLFEVDRRPFEASLQLARANLARDQALARDAESEARWVGGLFASGSAADRERDQAEAQAEAKEAQVKADEAAVEAAELELEYCTIRSPLDGRVGALLTDQGNVVEANVTQLVVINQVHPIYVSFSVAERHLSSIRHYQTAGPLTVEVHVPQSDAAAEQGKLTFVDNQVDPTTGMIRLKGTFANERSRLWPGQFVDVSLILTMRPGAVVVPTQAVQAGPEGQFVFVVNDQSKVDMRSVSIGDTLGALSVVQSGLKPGEQVVTDGQLRLTPGAAVAPIPGESGSTTQPIGTETAPRPGSST